MRGGDLGPEEDGQGLIVTEQRRCCANDAAQEAAQLQAAGVQFARRGAAHLLPRPLQAVGHPIPEPSIHCPRPVAAPARRDRSVSGRERGRGAGGGQRRGRRRRVVGGHELVEDGLAVEGLGL